MTEALPKGIRSAGPEDAPAMARCHAAAFPGEFLTLMGQGFLRAFYRFYIVRGGIALVAIDEAGGQVIGLVAGGEPSLRSRFTRRHVVRFVATLAVKSLQHRRIRQRLGEHLRAALVPILRKLHLTRPRAASDPEPTDPLGTWSNLLSVCTHPEFRGRGTGKALMEAFRIASANRGYRTMRLSVHNDNAAAMALYRSCGWRTILTTPKGTYFKRSVEDAP